MGNSHAHVNLIFAKTNQTHINMNKGMIAIAMAGCAAAGFIAGYNSKNTATGDSGRTKLLSVRDTVYDTITIRRPYAVTKNIIRYVPATLPVADTAQADSATVIVPVESRTYADSSFSAWLSGYNATLDSIRIYPRTITVTRYKQPRICVGVSAGIGLPIQGTVRVTPYLGIGVSYILWSR